MRRLVHAQAFFCRCVRRLCDDAEHGFRLGGSPVEGGRSGRRLAGMFEIRPRLPHPRLGLHDALAGALSPFCRKRPAPNWRAFFGEPFGRLALPSAIEIAVRSVGRIMNNFFIIGGFDSRSIVGGRRLVYNASHRTTVAGLSVGLVRSSIQSPTAHVSQSTPSRGDGPNKSTDFRWLDRAEEWFVDLHRGE